MKTQQIYLKKRKQTVHQFPNFTNKHNSTDVIQKHPVPAVLGAQLKQHKSDIPIRSVFTNISAPN